MENSKAEGSSNKRVAENPQVDSQSEVSEEQDNPIAKNIKLYQDYRNALHGIEPVWALPALDNNVKISFPGISS